MFNSKNGNSNNSPFVNFYGRTVGHLSEKSKERLIRCMPAYEVDTKDLTAQFFYEMIKKYDQINLEIGFGSGDFIFQSALKNPSFFYLGIEVFLNGVCSLLGKIDNLSENKDNLSNLKIYKDNLYKLLPYFHDNTFDNIYILFPDPWPKKKHHKRRVINQSNLELFSKILKPQGQLRFVSDHSDYVEWAFENFLLSNLFAWEPKTIKDFTKPPFDHFTTKYERKAIEEGRNITYINCRNLKVKQ